MVWWLMLASLALAEEPAEREAETGKGAGMGALQGAGYGALGGMVVSTFSPWYVEGELVNIYVHAGLDALIFAVPGALIGGVIGARQPTSTLRPGRVHLVAGFGFTDLLAQRSLKTAYEESGLAWTTPWWFGRPHWPRGFVVASPYAFNGGASVRVHPRWEVGAELADVSRQRVASEDGSITSWASAWNVSALGTWVLVPLRTGGSRWELAASAGLGLGRMASGGEVEGEAYRSVRLEPTVPLRMTADWYATRHTSLQLRVATRMHTQLEVDAPDPLVDHRVEFTSFDLTLGLRWHLGSLE